MTHSHRLIVWHCLFGVFGPGLYLTQHLKGNCYFHSPLFLVYSLFHYFLFIFPNCPVSTLPSILNSSCTLLEVTNTLHTLTLSEKKLFPHVCDDVECVASHEGGSLEPSDKDCTNLPPSWHPALVHWAPLPSTPSHMFLFQFLSLVKTSSLFKGSFPNTNIGEGVRIEVVTSKA